MVQRDSCRRGDIYLDVDSISSSQLNSFTIPTLTLDLSSSKTLSSQLQPLQVDGAATLRHLVIPLE
jgi:hypothetical protein